MRTASYSNPTSSEVVLQSLYLSSKNWLSYIDFVEDEIKLFKKLLIKFFPAHPDEQQLRAIQNIEYQIVKLEKQKIIVLDNIFRHQNNLRAAIEGMTQLSEEYLNEEHTITGKTVKDLQPGLDHLRNDLIGIKELKASVYLQNPWNK